MVQFGRFQEGGVHHALDLRENDIVRELIRSVNGPQTATILSTPERAIQFAMLQSSRLRKPEKFSRAILGREAHNALPLFVFSQGFLRAS